MLGVLEARTAKEMTCAYCPMRTSHTCRAVYNTEWQIICIGQMVDISRDNIVQGMEAIHMLNSFAGKDSCCGTHVVGFLVTGKRQIANNLRCYDQKTKFPLINMV